MLSLMNSNFQQLMQALLPSPLQLKLLPVLSFPSHQVSLLPPLYFYPLLLLPLPYLPILSHQPLRMLLLHRAFPLLHPFLS
jgi:hypothetical protein